MAKPTPDRKPLISKPEKPTQRRHNPKSRSPHPLPVRMPLNLPVQWTNWQGSKDHLFPVHLECKSTSRIPAAMLPTVRVFSAAKQLRDRNTCVACFYRYAEKQRRLREGGAA